MKALLFLLVAGCRIVYPGDGRLVIVEVSAAAAAAEILVEVPERELRVVLVGSLIRDAAGWWDRTGARLRTRDQLGAEDQIEARMAPILVVEVSLAPDPGNAGRYESAVGIVFLQLDEWVRQVVDEDELWLDAHRATIAHEFGHAMGHDHLTVPGAVMNSPTRNLFGLGPPDVWQHVRLWGTDIIPPGGGVWSTHLLGGD